MSNIQVLDSVELVFAAPRVISATREIGFSRQGAKAGKDTVDFLKPKVLNSYFSKYKQRAFVLLRNNATKLDSVGMWAVPTKDGDFRARKIEAGLEEISVGFDAAAKQFKLDYPDLVNQWADENPEDSALIRGYAPSPVEIERSISFRWGMMKAGSANIIAHDGLEDEIRDLPTQAAAEIAADLKESCAGSAIPGRGAIAALRRVADKASGWGFLSPALAAIKPTVNKLLEKATDKGFASEEDAMVAMAVIGFLQNPAKVIAEGRRIDTLLDAPHPAPVATVPLLDVSSFGADKPAAVVPADGYF